MCVATAILSIVISEACTYHSLSSLTQGPHYKTVPVRIIWINLYIGAPWDIDIVENFEIYLRYIPPSRLLPQRMGWSKWGQSRVQLVRLFECLSVTFLTAKLKPRATKPSFNKSQLYFFCSFLTWEGFNKKGVSPFLLNGLFVCLFLPSVRLNSCLFFCPYLCRSTLYISVFACLIIMLLFYFMS